MEHLATFCAICVVSFESPLPMP